MLVNAIYAKTIEHIERPHPFGVTLGQIVVDSDNVNTVACEGIEEHWQCGYKSLPFPSSHFGNLALVQHYASEELHVIMHHVPCGVVSAGSPMVVVEGFVTINVNKVVCGGQFAVKVCGTDNHIFTLGKTSCRTLHDGEGFGHHLVELLLHAVKYVFLQFVNLVEEYFAVFNREGFYLVFNGLYFFLNIISTVLYLLLQFPCFGSKAIVVELVDVNVSGFDLLHVW